MNGSIPEEEELKKSIIVETDYKEELSLYCEVLYHRSLHVDIVMENIVTNLLRDTT